MTLEQETISLHSGQVVNLYKITVERFNDLNKSSAFASVVIIPNLQRISFKYLVNYFNTSCDCVDKLWP